MKYLLIFIVFIGVVLRLISAQQWFMYSHDQDLLGWFILDVVRNGNLRLIGQETSQAGMFIGPMFYYLAIPFYLLFNWDPLGGVVLVTIIGALTIICYWYVFLKIFDKTTAFIATLLYSTSFAVALTDREVVPTTPVMLWSVWFLYALNLLMNGKQKLGWILTGILFGLVWHINMGLFLLTPLVLVAFALSKKKLQVRKLLIGLIVAMLLMIPFIVFEIRHEFSQTRTLLMSFSATDGEFSGGLAKFDRVMQLVSKNVHRLFVLDTIPWPNLYSFVVMIGIFVLLVIRKVIPRRLSLLIVLWIGIFILFFSLNSIIVSEYYLNGMTVVWLLITAVFISWIFSVKQLRVFAPIGLGIILLMNLINFSKYSPSASGYVERREIVQHINQDAIAHNYPCIAISYITKPGFDLGYRYLFWLEKMHVNKPDSNSPVYTIVFPHSLVDRIDKSFGALGLIYPDYERYNNDQVEESCSGENSNLTDPLFGYTN